MENKLKGGLADGKTIEDIARKHSVFVGTIKLALEKGMKVEKEHASDKQTEKEIAMDHLWEDPEYYEKLDKMENKGKKKIETKECTGADASGSVEAPIFGKTIMKKDIHKLHNFKSSKLNEVADSSISAGAMYDAPIGHKAKDPLDIDNPGKSTGTITGNKKMDSKSIAVTKKNFPKFGGPKSKFVSIDAKQTFPYSNQGDPKNSSLYEIKGMREAVKEAAKKYGLTIEQVEKMVMSEAYTLPNGIDFKAATQWGKKGQEEKLLYHLVTIDPETKEPTPLDFKTQDEIEFSKLKLILQGNGVKFHEEKRPLTDTDNLQQPDSPSAEEDDDDDFDFDNADDIFANMK